MGPQLCRKNDLVQSGRRQKKFKSIDGLSILTKMKENKKTDTKIKKVAIKQHENTLV